jgi:peptidoglycan/LPS O-acetylase OafA/YrhL
LIRRKWALAISAVTLAAYVVLYRTSFSTITAVYPNFFGYFPLAAFWKFGFGLALAHLWRPRALNGVLATVLESAAIAALLFAIVHGLPLAPDVASIAFVTIAIFTIAVFSCESGALSQVLLWPFLILLGEASYSLYLWHQMLMLWARDWLPANVDGDLQRLVLATVIIGSIILLSVITYIFFERPLRTWIGRPRSAPREQAVLSESTGKGTESTALAEKAAHPTRLNPLAY